MHNQNRQGRSPIQDEGIENPFCEIKTENFPKSWETHGHSGSGGIQNSKQTQPERTFAQRSKLPKVQIKERILKTAKEKQQVTFQGKPIRITDFSAKTL